MALNVGSLVAYLDLNDTNFDRKTKNANKQIDGLALHLKTLAQLDPELKIRTEATQAKLKALQDRLVELKAEAAKGADVRVDTAETMFKLAAVKAEIHALHREAGKSLELDTSNAETKLATLAKSLDNVGGKLKGLKVPGGMLGTLAALAPALIPASNAAIGVLGGISVAAVEAAGSMGVLKLALSGFGAASNAYQAYEATMANLHGTAKQQASQAAAAQRTLNKSAYGQNSTPQMQAFARTYADKWQPFQMALASSAQAGVLPGLNMGITSLIKDAPQINAAVGSIGNSMGVLFAQAGHALNSPFWKHWLLFFGRDSATNVQTMGHIFGQVFEGLARAMERGSGGAHSILGYLDSLATKFNHWTAGKGFSDWLASVRRDGHQVAVFLAEAWMALKPILQGLGQAGRTELTLLGGTFSLIAHLPTEWLVAAGHWLPLIFLAAKMGAPIMNGLGVGMQSVSKNLAKMAEDGASKSAIFAAGFMGAARAVAGPAGVGLLIDSLSHATSQMSTFESIVGGALAGGAVGGVWGAAIGGVVGLASAIWKAGDAASVNYDKLGQTQALTDAKNAVDALAQSLDQVTGAYTASTKAAIYNQLQNSSSGRLLLSTAARNGISGSEVVSAVQGNPKAMGAVNIAALGRIASLYMQNTRLKDTINNPYASYDQIDQATAALHRNQAEISAISAALGAWQGSLTQATAQQRAYADATNAVTTNLGITEAKFKSWPKSVQTVLELKNRPETMSQLQAIATAIEQIGPISRSQASSLVQALLKASPQIHATRSDVLGIVDALAGIRPKTVSVHINTASAVRSLGDLALQVAGLGAIVPVIHLPAGKKPGHNAQGTNFWGGGLSWVGENGPELINLPRGAQVIPHGRSEQMARAATAGATSAPVHLSERSIDRLAKAIITRTSSAVVNELEFAGGY